MTETLTHSPVTPPEGEPQKPERTSHKHRNIIIGVGSGVAAIALAGGLTLGLGSHSSPEPGPTTSASGAAPNPSASASENTENKSPIDSMEPLPTNLTGEQLGTLFVGTDLNELTMAGATDANRDAYLAANNSDQFVEDLSKKNVEVFADKYLVADWRDIQSLHDWVYNSLQPLNASSIVDFFKTDNDANDHSFKRTQTVTSSVESNGIVIVESVDSSNIKDTTAGKIDPAMVEATNNQPRSIELTFQVVGDVNRVASVQ